MRFVVRVFAAPGAALDLKEVSQRRGGHIIQVHVKLSVFVIDEYWDTNTVAEYLGVQPDFVREQTRRNHLPGEKVNNRWRFSAQEIMRIRNRHQ